MRAILFRFDALRFLAAFPWRAIHPATRYRIEHLDFYREADVLGALQRDEALFLFAVTRVQRPAVIVEFGFHHGHSAFNFLQALPLGSKLYSYDIDENSERIAATRFRRFSNFRFLRKSQTEFSPADIDNQLIDLCFLDASHLLELNQVTFRRIEPFLAPRAIIAVHDTGTWAKPFFGAVHQTQAAANPADWITQDEFQPCREEREFVNWLLANHPAYSQIHLHSTRTLRNGFTLIQKSGALATTRGNVDGAPSTVARDETGGP